jgi:hypothetical protein
LVSFFIFSSFAGGAVVLSADRFLSLSLSSLLHCSGHANWHGLLSFSRQIVMRAENHFAFSLITQRRLRAPFEMVSVSAHPSKPLRQKGALANEVISLEPVSCGNELP